MRNLSRFVFTILLTVGLFAAYSGTAYAANKTGFLEINATVPDGFTNSILINYFDEKGYNVMVNLKSINKYRYKEAIPVGKYTLDFSTVYHDVLKEYQIQSPVQMEVNLKQLTVIDLSVAKAEINTPKNEIPEQMKLPENQEQQAILKVIETLNTTQTTSLITPTPSPSTQTPTNTSQPQGNNPKFRSTDIFTLAIYSILAIILMIFKVRKMIRRN